MEILSHKIIRENVTKIPRCTRLDFLGIVLVNLCAEGIGVGRSNFKIGPIPSREQHPILNPSPARRVSEASDANKPAVPGQF